MSMESNWTAVRFPNGEWSYGGSVDGDEYKNCEVFVVRATNGKEAVKKAQAKRSARLRKEKKDAEAMDRVNRLDIQRLIKRRDLIVSSGLWNGPVNEAVKAAFEDYDTPLQGLIEYLERAIEVLKSEDND